MRRFLPLLFVVLAACAAPLAQEDGQGGHTARFPEFPDILFDALEKNCAGPAQEYSRPRHNLAECREFLDPEATAAIILTYDGTAEDLPQMVIRLIARPDGGEYLLTTLTYLDVPQKDHGTIHVTFPSARFDRTLRALYRRAGGVPQ